MKCRVLLDTKFRRLPVVGDDGKLVSPRFLNLCKVHDFRVTCLEKVELALDLTIHLQIGVFEILQVCPGLRILEPLVDFLIFRSLGKYKLIQIQ